MRGTFFGIEIARTGLSLGQLGLDVTGHNIANVETRGYTRQRIIQTAYDPSFNIGKILPVMQARVGSGTRVKILDQIRSAYLDRRFRTENTINAYWDTRTRELRYLESFFDNVNEETSINYSISRLFSAMKVLAEDTVEGAPRKLLQTAGLDLVQQLNTIHAGLMDLQDTQNKGVQIAVDEINRIAAELVELNKAIYGFELTGHVANDLRDKRNVLLDDLSSFIDIEYDEYTDKWGATAMKVFIGGTTLVDHDKRNELDVRLVDNTIAGENQVLQPVWLLDQALFGGAPITLNGAPLTGDTTNNDFQRMIARINDLAARIDALNGDISDAVLAGAPIAEIDELKLQRAALVEQLGGIVDIGNITQAQLDGDAPLNVTINGADLVGAGGVTNVAISGAAAEVPLAVTGGELKAIMDMRDNDDVLLPGIPRYIQMLNDLARTLVMEINEAHRQGYNDPPIGVSVNGINFFYEDAGWFQWIDAGGDTLTYDDVLGVWVDAGGTVVPDPAAAGYEWLIDVSKITAKNIRLSDEVMQSEFNIACSSVQIRKRDDPEGQQRGNNENMRALFALFNKTDISLNVLGRDVSVGSFDSFATSIRFDIGSTLDTSKNMFDTSRTLTLSAENQRTSVSGVSLDEEMTNLIRYNHAYNGAARVITAMDDALDRLINGTGRVGL